MSKPPKRSPTFSFSNKNVRILHHFHAPSNLRLSTYFVPHHGSVYEASCNSALYESSVTASDTFLFYTNHASAT
jgi:hypothetical protein